MLPTKEIIQCATDARLVIINDGVHGKRWYKSECGLELDELVRYTSSVVNTCLKILADKGNYEGGAVESFNAIVERFELDPSITYYNYFYEHQQ